MLRQSSNFNGNASQEDLNRQDIGNIIAELNRLSAGQDALNNTFSIIATGKTSFTSTNGNPGGVTVSFNSQNAYTFMAFWQSSDLPGQYYQIPANIYDNTGTLTKTIYGYSTSSQLYGSGTSNITFTGRSYNGTATFTIFYFLLQQPADVALS